MQRQYQAVLAVLFGITIIGGTQLVAQAPRGGRGGRGATGAAAGPARGGGGLGAYPSRPPADPAVVARGKATYDANCASCHAADLRGASGGINLVHNQMVLDDQQGELIGKFLQNPHDGGKAPKMNLTAEQVRDLAIFMHTFESYRTIVKPPDINEAILQAGNAKAGEAYFNQHCASCHSVTGDLKGVGSKYSEARSLQNAIVSGGGGGGRGRGRGGAAAGPAASRRTVTATVTEANGRKLEGRLEYYDDFLITIVDADGVTYTIKRNGDVPKLEIHDPMKAHRDMLLTFQDADIHNLTAYLVTVK